MSNFDIGPRLNQLASADINAVISALNMMQGLKDITLDDPVMYHLDRLCGVKLLKSHGVCKIFSLKNQKYESGGEESQHIFITRPSMLNMKQIADQINADLSTDKRKQYKILMVPKKLHVAELILEQEGVYGNVSIDQLALHFQILDDGLMSLEMPEFFKSFFVDGEQSSVHSIASSLCNIQNHFGKFRSIFSQGRCSKLVVDLMNDLYTGADKPSSEIGYVFLFDRDVDFASVLMTQMTFEGMLDETFEIKNGVVQFGSDVTGQAKNVKLKLNSEDKLFDELRDQHMSNVFQLLGSKVKQIQTSYEKRHDMSLSEMRQFVSGDLKGLKQQHQSLGYFVGASEVIMKQKKNSEFDEFLATEHSLVEGTNYKENLSNIEEAINRQFKILSTLRLMCLLSLTQGGLSTKDYKSLVQQFCQSHGFQHLMTFQNMKKLGIFTPSDSFQLSSVSKLADKVASAVLPTPLTGQKNFRSVAKKLNLIPKIDECYDLKTPSDTSYVYSGAYTAIIPLLVQHVLDKKGFTGLEDVLKQLPGPTVSKPGNLLTSPPPVALVYFIGGVTRAELAALKLIGRMKGWKMLIATTSFITGNTMMSCLID